MFVTESHPIPRLVSPEMTGINIPQAMTYTIVSLLDKILGIQFLIKRKKRMRCMTPGFGSSIRG